MTGKRPARCSCRDSFEDPICPVHHPGENERRLAKAKKELQLILRYLDKGMSFQKARIRAHNEAWGPQRDNLPDAKDFKRIVEQATGEKRGKN